MANPTWPNLSERYRGDEQMDNPDFSGEDLRLALKHLEHINRWFGNYRSVLLALKTLLSTNSGREPLHIVDIGCGGGDLMCYVNQFFRKKKIAVRFTGIDVNPPILEKAGQRMCNDKNVFFEQADVLDSEFEILEYDIVIYDNLIYRFNEDELENFIERNRSQVRYAFVFSELLRSRTSYLLLAIFGQLLFPGRVTIADGLVAIRRSFTDRELSRAIAVKWPEVIIRQLRFLRQIAILPAQ